MMTVNDVFYGNSEPTHIISDYSDITAFAYNQPCYMGPVVELKVPMCCVKCEEKVKESLLEMEGVVEVTTDHYNQKVAILGTIDPDRALKRVRRIKKRSDFWPQSPAQHKWSSPNHTTRGAQSPMIYDVPYVESSFDRLSYSQSAFTPSYIETTYDNSGPSYNQIYDSY